MYTVLFINGQSQEINETQAKDLFRVMNAGQKKHVMLPSGMFAISSISAVMKTEDYLKKEGEELEKRNRFRCNKGMIHTKKDGCYCYEKDKRDFEGKLLEEPDYVPPSKETMARVREAMSKLSTHTPKRKETKEEREKREKEAFHRRHPGLHEFSESVKKAYAITGLN